VTSAVTVPAGRRCLPLCAAGSLPRAPGRASSSPSPARARGSPGSHRPAHARGSPGSHRPAHARGRPGRSMLRVAKGVTSTDPPPPLPTVAPTHVPTVHSRSPTCTRSAGGQSFGRRRTSTRRSPLRRRKTCAQRRRALSLRGAAGAACATAARVHASADGDSEGARVDRQRLRSGKHFNASGRAGARPVSTEGGTRRVQLVRERGGRGAPWRSPR